MNKKNVVIELFTGYSYSNKETQEMKANASVTLVKSENKIILVSRFVFHIRKKKSINHLRMFLHA